MKRLLALFVALLLLVPASSFALSPEEIMKKIQDLTNQIQELKKQMQEMQNKQMQQQADVMDAKDQAKEVKSKFGWLTIGGDYRFRFDSLRGDVHEHFNFSDLENQAYEIWQSHIMLGGYYASQGITYPLVKPWTNPLNGQTYLITGLSSTELNQLFGAAMKGNSTAKNDALLTNRFRLTIKAQATENIAVKARLAMYKIWGHQTSGPLTDAGYFADRMSTGGAPFDGQTGHLPMDNKLVVDYAYATWSNVFDLPVWFSVGRRPSTEGIPTNIRQNREKVGTAGVPGLMIDYAFDGLTLGFAPYIEALPGFYAKVCYGKGFDSGFRTDIPGDSTPKDVDFLGINIVPIDTDNFHVELQWDRAFNIFDTFPDSGVKANLGDIDQYGITATYKVENLGAGDLTLFASAALSKTHPSDEMLAMDIFTTVDMNGDGIPDDLDGDGYPDLMLVQNQPLAGLLFDADQNGQPVDKDSKTGHAFYVGARYDIKSTGTKIGLEYNYGSKNWITFGPAADDMWTNKLGTRGEVYEAYLIQELPEMPIAKMGKAYFRLGYQYYKFRYTGSNSWIGAPKKIDDLTSMNYPQFMAPLKNAHDIYFTFDVTF
ncbi:MAG: DUF3373 family protein [Nitrospirae bacterium]|nr:DUF3373 family protein [Nitrospirota bacterium]